MLIKIGALLFAILLLLSGVAQAQGESPSPTPTPIPAGPPPMMGPPAAPPAGPTPGGPVPSGRVIVRRVPRGGTPPPPPPPQNPPPAVPPGLPGMPQNVPPGVLPPAQPVTPPPAIPTTAPKEVPKYAGPVRIQIFSELIATGSESAKIIDDKKRETIESVLNRVTGVKSVAFRPADRMFEAVFEGKYEDLAAFKPAMASTGVPSEMVSPLEIVFRPGSLPVQNPDKLKETLGKVPGVKAVVQDGNAFKCYADVETDLAAIESAGGSVMSHEWLSLAVSAVPDNAETAVTDLANTKYVLRVEVEDAQVKVLCVKGRVTKALLKSILTKNGFKVK